MVKSFRIRVGDRWYKVELSLEPGSKPGVLVDGQPLDVEIEAISQEPRPKGGISSQAQAIASGVVAPSQSKSAPLTVSSPMPGRIVAVAVKAGDKVSSGSEVCVLEAMKMEQSIRVSRGGSVKAVHVEEGQQVQAGQALVELE